MLVHVFVCFVVVGAVTGTPVQPKVRIGAPLTENHPTWSEIGKQCRFVYSAWAKHVNAQGGVNITGQGMSEIEFVFYDLGKDERDMVDQLNTIVEEWVAKDRVDLVFSPYSSRLSPFVPLAAPDLIVMNPGAASSSVFLCDDSKLPPCTEPRGKRFVNQFGFFASARVYFTSFIWLCKIFQLKSVFIFMENDAFPINSGKGARSVALEVGMQVVSEVTIPRMSTDAMLQLDILRSLLHNISSLAPDVVIGAVYQLLAERIPQLAKEENIKLPKAMAMTLMDISANRTAESPDVYMITPTQWDDRLFDSDPLSPVYEEPLAGTSLFSSVYMFPSIDHPSPKVFSDWFSANYGSKPLYQTAACLAAGYSTHMALLMSESTDPSVMGPALESLDEPSFFGKIGFDSASGKRKSSSLVSLQLALSGPHIVTPLFAATSPLELPLAQYNERVPNLSLLARTEDKVAVCIAVFTMLLLLALIFSFVWWRNSQPIRNSRPTICTWTLVGGMCVVAGLLTWMLQNSSAMCFLRHLIAPCVLLFLTPIISKNFFVVKVYRSSHLRRISVSDGDIFRLSACLAAPCLVLSLLWIVFEVSGRHLPSLIPPKPLTQEFVVVDPIRPSSGYEECSSSGYLFMTLTIVYVGIIVLGGFGFALYQNVALLRSDRSIDQFHNSRALAFTMYNMTLVLGLLLTLDLFSSMGREEVFLLRVILVDGAVILSCLSLFAKPILDAIRLERIRRNTGTAPPDASTHTEVTQSDGPAFPFETEAPSPDWEQHSWPEPLQKSPHAWTKRGLDHEGEGKKRVSEVEMEGIPVVVEAEGAEEEEEDGETSPVHMLDVSENLVVGSVGMEEEEG